MTEKRADHHNPDDIETRAKLNGKAIEKAQLISSLNQFSFRQDPISLQFMPGKSKLARRIQVIPQLCDQETVICTYCPAPEERPIRPSDKVTHLQIQDGEKLIMARPRKIEFKEGRICLTLPEGGREILARKIRRHSGRDIGARIEMEGRTVTATLFDFHAFSFSCTLSPDESGLLENDFKDKVCRVALQFRGNQLYEGACRIIRQGVAKNSKLIVLSPTNNNIPVLKPKKHRSDRVRPVPTPGIRFNHPLTGQAVYLDIVELSGSGFAVYEKLDQAILMPGLTIRDVRLELANIFSFNCGIRVVNCKITTQTTHVVETACHVGCIIDAMEMKDHAHLVAYLQHTKDHRALTCTPPDMQALWEFFFATGFIYPKKYQYIFTHREKIQRTFEKLYLEQPQTSRHFLFQDKGVINGHIALQWAYTDTWMIHHFAARRQARIAGPKVLNQIGSFMNDSYHLETNRMKYVIVYYRPENKFPSRVFGGMARNAKDPKICSQDTLAYFHVHRPSAKPTEIGDGYHLSSTTQTDLDTLKKYYDQISKGLMLDALDLIKTTPDDAPLRSAHHKAGLKRERYLSTLKKGATPQAILMACGADMGVNLSDFTNCIHVFIMAPKHLDQKPLRSALEILSQRFEHSPVVVNLFPAAYARSHAMAFDKHYSLWAIKTHHSDYYFDYLKRLSRFFKP